MGTASVKDQAPQSMPYPVKPGLGAAPNLSPAGLGAVKAPFPVLCLSLVLRA